MRFRSIMDCFCMFLEYFAKNTSIHGIHFIGNKENPCVGRILWLIIVLFALSCSYIIIKSNWNHYIESPTVVTIKKDFRNWENPFPAATGCFLNKVDEGKAATFIETRWNISKHNEKYEYYLNFVKTVSNLTYETFHTLEKFKNDAKLNEIDFVSLITNVHPELSGTLVTFQSKVEPKWNFIMTELGLCFTLNYRFAELLSPNLILNTKPKFEVDFLKCHYLNGLCYARYDCDNNVSIAFHIHSPLEVIHATSERPLNIKTSEECEVNYKLTQTYSLEDIRYLTPNQRKCRFDDEPLTANVPVYSTSICYMECRYRLSMEMCGCKPFFYTFLDGKQCDITGLLCLAKISNLFNRTTQIRCDCAQPCNLIVYLKQVPKITEWDIEFFEQRVAFRWGLILPTTKYQRKIIFGSQELMGKHNTHMSQASVLLEYWDILNL
ncbi:unnamed protein product [Ceutorhynchus assimilis]|uniref:Sodium channel protein n=1 Tax=Ceutorhynchus assimilis TaxID=467358 RepID=A0A9N9MQN5_9CUCU|nr:unnamed protein product [Ceutorhynchus assimilis]